MVETNPKRIVETLIVGAYILTWYAGFYETLGSDLIPLEMHAPPGQ